MKLIFTILISLAFSIHIFAQSKVSKDQAIEDIDYFNKVLLEVHYNPFLFATKEFYFKKVEELKQSIKDSIGINDLILNLYKITSIIEDSHTSPSFIQPSLIKELKNDNFFPYLIVNEKNKLYFPISTAQKLHIQAGSELISINNFEVEKLLKDFNKCFGGLKEYSNEMSMRLFPYLLFLKGILPPYNITYKSKTKIKSQIIIKEGTTFKNALINYLPSLSKAYEFNILDNKLGLLRFNSMSIEINAFDRYIDSCVTIMKNKNIKHWAIDLRDNSGGNSILADLLISYFNSNDYSLMGKREWKISQQYKEYLLSQGDSTNEYLSKPNGTLWELGNCKPGKPKFENNNVFNGKIILITGPFTFSSANMFADGVKKYKLAEIVGTNTGENTNDFGEVYSFTLPKTKIKMQVTTSFDLGTNCLSKELEPVKPDIVIKTPLKYKINEEDYIVKKIIENIK